jgi:multiple sugar transport system substrate-binding protein
MKKILALLTATILGLAFAQTSLVVGVFEPLNEHLELVLPQFRAENPDIEIEIRTLGYADHHNVLVTALATGSGAPDVAAVEIGFIARFMAEGGLTDLSQEPYNADELADLFVDYAWAQSRTPEGRQIAIPTDIAPGVMYYRRDHLQEAGWEIADVIASIDSYLDYGRALKDMGVFLVADAGSVANALIRSDVPEGDGIYFDAEGNPVLNGERFVNAATVAQTIRVEGLDAQIGAWTNEWYEAFRQGTTATELSGAWLGGHLQTWMAPDTSGLWGASEMPGDILVSWGGSFYGIPTQSQNKEAAWKLIEFLTTNPEVQLAAFQTINAFPAMPETYDAAMFDDELEFLAGQRARQLFAEVAQQIPGVRTDPGDVIAEEIFNSAMAQILNEGVEVQAALDEAQSLVERRLRRR